jgi:Protein of unknown function (DUF2934)
MMSKKKKDKADEPKKAKARSSRKSSEEVTNRAGEPASFATTGAPAVPKLRRAVASKQNTSALEINDDDIALRAYYIAEHRRRLDLPGDEMGDWVEAERQLRKEAGKKSA